MVEGRQITMSDIALIRKYDLGDREPLQNDHDYADVPNFPSASHSAGDVAGLSDFTKASVSYIAGYVGNMTAKHSWCKECCDALGSPQHKAHSLFLKSKDKGGLFKPTSSVIYICEETEVKFRRLLRSSQGKLPQSPGIVNAIC